MKRGRKPTHELSLDMATLDRLTKDGAYSKEAVRRRIALLAAERKLDPSETKALMKGRWLTVRHIGEFMEKHDLSADWLIGGDLKGRLRMARKEFATRPEPPRSPSPALTTEAFGALLGTMTAEEKQWLFAKMRKLLGDAP